MRRVIAESGQTLIDLSIQEMGSIEGLFDLSDANPLIPIDVAIAPGTPVRIPDTIYNAQVADYYKKNALRPSSGLGEEITIPLDDDSMIRQTLNYDLINGDQEFPGVRLHSIKNRLTVQINYTGLTSSMVKFSIDHSLDGLQWSQVPDSGYTLDPTRSSHTYVIIGLLTNYVRGHVELGEPCHGIITEILWKYE